MPFVPPDHPDGGFDVRTRVSNKDVANLLCGAFEGGTYYWCVIVEIIKPPEDVIWSDRNDQGELDEGAILYRKYDYPVTPGGAVVITTQEEYDEAEGDVSKMKTYRLDRDTIARGLNVMLKKYPSQLAAFLEGNDDADTADIFVQCCAFGEIVYG